MSGSILIDLEEIIEQVLKHLPMKHLHKCARVCKKWNEVVKRLKRARKQLCWLLYHRETSEGLEGDIAGQIHLLPSEPRVAMVFCSSSLQENKVAVATQSGATSSRYPRAAKLEKLQVTDYLQRVLPPGCKVIGSCTDGVVGTPSWKSLPREFEGYESLSCLLLPQLEGVEIHQFHINPAFMETLGPNATFTRTDEPDATTLDAATGIPGNKKPKLVLLFETENQDLEVGYALLRRYRNIVVAGGYVDGLIPEEDSVICGTEQDAEIDTDRGEATGLGIAFIGDNIRVASALVSRRAKTKEDVLKTLKKLSDCHVPSDNLVGFMFACIGRGEHYYRQRDLESGIFHGLFPGVPLFGFFGNGETGYDYLPDYSTPEGDSTISLIGEYPDDESGFVWDVPPIQHSYTTIFVLMSLGK